MTDDPGRREPRGPRPTFRLPHVTHVEVRRAHVEPPPHRNFPSLLPALDTVEILVETDGPVPVRDVGPVLFVGDVPVTEVTADDERHYRFLALRPDELRAGAPMVLGWAGQTSDRVDTRARFAMPASGA